MWQVRTTSPVGRASAAVMLVSVALVSCSGGGTSKLSGGKSFKAKHEPWREQVEAACLRSGQLPRVPWIEARAALGGPSSVCGALRPLKVSATGRGSVALKPAATLRCPMVPAIERWMLNVVKPAARRHLGGEINGIKVLASYGCRPRNNKRGAKLSEHGYANALDVSRFKLADGRSVEVKQWHRGSGGERAFLRAVHRGSCKIFTTVLGPEADRYHRDHFHLDLARHNRSGTFHYCR